MSKKQSNNILEQFNPLELFSQMMWLYNFNTMLEGIGDIVGEIGNV